jgi:hypothetical protein
MSKVTPTQRSLARLKSDGYVSAVVEKWNAHLKIRQDLFGFIDVIGVGPLGTIAVQSTSKTNFSSRWNKITGKSIFKDKKEEDRALKIREKVIACLAAGWVIEVQGWAGANDVRIQRVTHDDLVPILFDKPEELF